jgi:hypothetical protein
VHSIIDYRLASCDEGHMPIVIQVRIYPHHQIKTPQGRSSAVSYNADIYRVLPIKATICFEVVTGTVVANW